MNSVLKRFRIELIGVSCQRNIEREVALLESLHEKGLPEENRPVSELFDPWLDLTMGMTDDEMTERFRLAVQISIWEKKIKGVPVPGWDRERKEAFLEYPDGHREYSGDMEDKIFFNK